MKKVVFLFPIILFVHFTGFAQFSFHVFPMGVSGDAYADTILNTRAVLLKAGVKQINAHQTLPEVTKTFASKTVQLNKDGQIDKMTICFARNKETNFTLCVYDIIFYDTVGRLASIKITDSKGNNNP